MMLGSHYATLPISQRRPDAQDDLYGKLLFHCKDGIAILGEFIARVTEEVVCPEKAGDIAKDFLLDIPKIAR